MLGIVFLVVCGCYSKFANNRILLQPTVCQHLLHVIVWGLGFHVIEMPVILVNATRAKGEFNSIPYLARVMGYPALILQGAMGIPPCFNLHA